MPRRVLTWPSGSPLHDVAMTSSPSAQVASMGAEKGHGQIILANLDRGWGWDGSGGIAGGGEKLRLVKDEVGKGEPRDWWRSHGF